MDNYHENTVVFSDNRFKQEREKIIDKSDEPTGNLDSKSGKAVINALDRINQKDGKTIVMVTHDPQMASHCTRIILLKDGTILDILKKEEGTEEFYQEILARMADL